MSTRLPVNLLTGFLGSGKTTLLNRLLRSPALATAAVLVNEFGDVGIDHHLVNRISGGPGGEVVLLPSGCICCTIRGDVASTLRELHAQRERGEVPAFDRIVIETTGLADPTPLVATVMHDRVLQHHLRIGNVVTTVDAVHGLHTLDHHTESVKQAALADRLILTKLDLAAPEATLALRERLHAVNPGAAIVDSAEPTDVLAALLCADSFAPESRSAEAQRWLEASRHRQYLSVGRVKPVKEKEEEETDPTPPANAHATVRSIAIDLPDAIDWTAFSLWLSLLLHLHGRRVLRVKGLLNVQGTETPVVLHGVQQLVHPPSHLDAWPPGWAGDSRRSRLVFIVDGLPPERIEAALHAFLRTQAPAPDVLVRAQAPVPSNLTRA